MAQFNLSSTSYNSRIKYVETFLANMTTQQQKTGMSGILLAGDPGVGKTSFVKFFSTLLGIELIVIEAPHITEEHIINIPFIVFTPQDKRERSGVAAEKESDYKIILSKSHLVSQINNIKKIPDEQYLELIYRQGHDIITIFEHFGGDRDTIPEEFAEVREHFKALLFLDEFYRQTSTRIRNMLRGILNGKIGTDKVPPGTYVMYASNMSDNNDAVEGMPLNHQYANMVEFKAPNKEDWFGWLVSKFQKDEKVKLNKRVIDEFYTILKDEDINHEDVDKEVRISPRRWEQLILMINAGLPAKDEKSAKGLLTNVKNNFKNYLTGEHAALGTKVLDSVVKLIKETSGFELSKTSVHDDADWRDTLAHQIEMKIKLGKHRKYIPIMSGMPGVGKTTHAAHVAEELGLRYIYIDCSTLDPEDVIGIPLSKTKDDGVETSFSTPKLYKQLMDDIKEQDEEYMEELNAEQKEDYKRKEFKYLIFFDELNRTSTKVFNGLRRVILEKSFGDDLALPEGSVIVAAINPHDHGANELTHHMRDVVDVIETGASWEKTKAYLENMKVKTKSDISLNVVKDVINRFAEKFKQKGESDIKDSQRQFYLDVGADRAYISPREYSDLYSNAAIRFDRKFARLMKGNTADMTNEQLKAAEDELRETLSDSFVGMLKGILHKQDINSPEFLETLHDWFMNSPDIDLGEGIFYRKNKAADFPSIIEPYFDDPKKHLVDDSEFQNYLNTAEPHQFKSDLVEYMLSKIKDLDKAKGVISDKSHPKKVVTLEKVEYIEDELISKFEHIFREIVQTFEVLKLSNDKRQAAKEAAKEALVAVANDAPEDMFDDMMEIQRSFGKFLKGKAK